jgi:2-keto-4-pentenoate hydratase
LPAAIGCRRLSDPGRRHPSAWRGDRRLEGWRRFPDDRGVLRADLCPHDSPQPRLLRRGRTAAEIAFRLGRDLPARSAPYDRSEVTAGATLHPVIEIVDSRYADFQSRGRPSILADNYSNGGLVWGAAVPGWETLDLARTEMRVTEDGKPFADSSMAAPRDPIAALVDFANLMRQRGGAKAGAFVTTGSWTGMAFTQHGTHIAADFGPLGRVEIAFPSS